jgi:Holliday junction resolvasome RuvABC ATP-dependent DNA helicase subunit
VRFHAVSGSEFQNNEDVYKYAQDWLEPGEKEYKIRMIDEAHMIKKNLSATFNFMIDCNLNGRSVLGKIEKPCIFIFCSEFEDRLQESLRGRFVHHYRLAPYTVAELLDIMRSHLPELKSKFNFKGTIEKSALEFIAERSRRNARFAVNNLTRCLKEAETSFTISLVKENFNRNMIHEFGLTRPELVLLYHLNIKTSKHQGGQPLSLSKIADQLSINKDQISNIYEPFLNSCGFLEISSRGRSLTMKAEALVQRNEEEYRQIYKDWKTGRI